MSRNMKDANRKFFERICDQLSPDLSLRVVRCVRYISTNEDEKEWLKLLKIKRIHRFSKSSFGILITFKEKAYLCLINTNKCRDALPEILDEVPVNSGLATALGSEGFLTPHINSSAQYDIVDKVLYDIEPEEYHGHVWEDIKQYFPKILCYEIKQDSDTTDIKEDINMFYWLLSCVAFEFDMGNNPFGQKAEEAWGKIIYEGDRGSIEFKNLLLSYTALSWDISYLYLYQCIEDKFTYESVSALHKKLNVEVTIKEFSAMLYDELSWQAKDLEGISRILEKCKSSMGVKLIRSICGEEAPEKYIYTVRNRTVHETRETVIPLDDNDRWDTLVAAMLYLLIDM